jgi:1,2-diacylglycerol-3-alpha-glucose alpha-1,2-galactosyltransferase
MKVNLVSESAYFAKQNGVHTMVEETRVALARCTGVEVLANSLRAADVTHVHTVGPLALRGLRQGPGLKVVSAHMTPGTFQGSMVGAGRISTLLDGYLRWFYNQADLVLAVSDEVTRELKALGVRVPVRELPNALDLDGFRVDPAARAAARAEMGLADDDFMVLGVGQIQPRKGIREFTECAAALPDVRFQWVGGMLFGPFSSDRDAMRKLMREAPPNLEFTGALPREALPRHYAAADLFYFPSFHETFGLVVIEAAAAGLPLLLRDLPTYTGAFGDTFVASSSERFLDDIRRFRSDPPWHRHWAARSAELAAGYGSETYAHRLLDLYREFVG